jgi:PAS domain S-box-containing protein
LKSVGNANSPRREKPITINEENVDCVDIIERKFNTNKAIEKEIRQKAASKLRLFSAALNMPDDGIIVGDLYGFIIYVNDAIIKMYGATDKNKFVGKHVTEFLVKSDKERAVSDSMNILTSGQGKTSEYRALTITGEEVPIEVTITLVRDENGESIGFVDIVRNISIARGMKKSQRRKAKSS